MMFLRITITASGEVFIEERIKRRGFKKPLIFSTWNDNDFHSQQTLTLLIIIRKNHFSAIRAISQRLDANANDSHYQRRRGPGTKHEALIGSAQA